MNEEVKKLITEAKNICVIPSQEPESLTGALALFYTLKELQKNVNLMIDLAAEASALPAQLQFLVPSLEAITQPKNFVISIPSSVADISKISYEKSEEALKIHLTADKGFIKKDHISLYIANVKPDLIITLGVRDFKAQLDGPLNSFGFLLGAAILNIDTHEENTRFGQVNIIEGTSISEMAMKITQSAEAVINSQAANALLAGIMLHYDNLKSPQTTSDTFQLVSELIKKGADYAGIISNLSKPTERELYFIEHIFKNLTHEHGVDTARLSREFYNFSEGEAGVAVEKVRTIGFSNELLVLWPSHNSSPAIKGFFYSKKPHLINKFAEQPYGSIKNGWVFLSFPGQDIDGAKEQIIKLL